MPARAPKSSAHTVGVAASVVTSATVSTEMIASGRYHGASSSAFFQTKMSTTCNGHTMQHLQ